MAAGLHHWTAEDICDLVTGDDQEFCFPGSDDDFGIGDLEEYDALQREQGRCEQDYTKHKNLITFAITSREISVSVSY